MNPNLQPSRNADLHGINPFLIRHFFDVVLINGNLQHILGYLQGLFDVMLHQKQ